MKKTVREIIEMITNGELHYNQSTQRKFVYASLEAEVSNGISSGKTTKSGSLINAILEDNVQLPAVYFWFNTDTNQLNIHDGKQRLLSLYYFINPTSTMKFSTIRNNKETLFVGLSKEDKDKLLDYTFDIVERSGNSYEEERSFYLINTNSINLTSYECVSGMLHGTFLTDFEKYIDALKLDKVNHVGRGEQAYKFLLTIFGLNDSKQRLSNDKTIINLCNKLRPVRNNNFVAEDYRFNEIVAIFNTLVKALEIKEDRALAVAAYIINSNYVKEDIVDYYKQSAAKPNDIKTWDIATHKTFIDKFVLEGLRLDPKRMFDKAVKDALFTKSHKCAHPGCTETSYSKLEVDHIDAWSNGGRTTIDNAQLLCKHHNTSKNNK